MFLYLRTKFQVSSNILTSFRQGRDGFRKAPQPQNERLKKSTKIMVDCLSILEQIIGFLIPNSFKVTPIWSFFYVSEIDGWRE